MTDDQDTARLADGGSVLHKPESPGWSDTEAEPPPEPLNPDDACTDRTEATVTGQGARKPRPSKRRAAKRAPSKPALVTQDGDPVPQDTGNATDQSEPPPKSRERYERDQDGLTFKQRQFVIAMLKGSTASDAYRASYDAAKMKPSTVHEAASRLMLNSKISARLDAGFRRLEETALHSAASHRRLIEERLVALAQDADTDAASIRAIELLGKLENVQAFKERIDLGDQAEIDPEDLEQALQARLAELFAKAG
jgi:hypothetical protein